MTVKELRDILQNPEGVFEDTDSVHIQIVDADGKGYDRLLTADALIFKK